MTLYTAKTLRACYNKIMSYAVGTKFVWAQPEPTTQHRLYDVGEYVNLRAKKILVVFA